MRTLCVTIIASFALAANANTLVHYTFDDLGGVGTKINGLSTIQNDAKAGTYAATVYQMAGKTKNTTSTSESDWLFVTNGIPETFRVFDPVARASASSVDRAVRFASPGGGQAGAMLETATDSSFFTESFTVEALVHFPVGMADKAYGVLATQLRDDSSYAWRLHFTWNRELQVNFCDDNGDVIALQDLKDNKVTHPDKFNDGKWHHIAMTVVQSESSATVKIFFDYVLQKTRTLSCRVQFPESVNNSTLQIGGTTLTGALFMGEIGEFRYSDSALTVDNFLRPRSTNSRLDDDCVLYYDFEDMTDDWSWFSVLSSSTEVVNKASPGIMDGHLSSGEVTGFGTLPKIDTAVPSNATRLSGSDNKLHENVHSFYNNYQDGSHRASGKCLYCDVADGISFVESDFTIEMFYKTDGFVNYWTPLFRGSNSRYEVYMGIGNTVNAVDDYFCGIVTSTTDGSVTNMVTVTDTSITNDGKWHHLALVRNGRLLTLYRDGASVSSGMLDYDSLFSRSPRWLIGGGFGGVNAFNGWIDSVRVTLRALEPEEFLQKASMPGFSIFIR